MTASKTDQHDARKSLLQSVADEALDAFWHVVVQRYPQAQTGDLSPMATITLQTTAENAIGEWIDNNVRPSPEDVIKCDTTLSALLAHLDNNHVRLKEFGSYVAVSEDRSTLFDCPILPDGSPDRSQFDPRHMNWGEVIAPENQAFLDKVNELFGTSFKWERFAGR